MDICDCNDKITWFDEPGLICYDDSMVGEMTLKQAVEEYKDVYLAYRNYAERTRKEYTNDLEDMVEYLGRVGLIM